MAAVKRAVLRKSYETLVIWVLTPLAFLSGAAYLLPTLMRQGSRRRALAPRQQLERLWVFARGLLAALSVVFGMYIFMLVLSPGAVRASLDVDIPGYSLCIVTWGLCAAVFRPPVRRQARAWLGRLVSMGEAQQAAAVAGMLGGQDGAQVLETAKKTFRTLPLNRLTLADLQTNSDTDMRRRTRKGVPPDMQLYSPRYSAASTPSGARLTAANRGHRTPGMFFMSHSWSDNAEDKCAPRPAPRAPRPARARARLCSGGERA